MHMSVHMSIHMSTPVCTHDCTCFYAHKSTCMSMLMFTRTTITCIHMSVHNFCRQYSTPAGDTLALSSSMREAAKLAAATEAAVVKSSSFGLLALQDKLSFRHWSMIDATPAEIKLFVADVVTYKWNVAARMIARVWRQYVFQTRAATLTGTSAPTTRPPKVDSQVMQLQAEIAQLKKQLEQHKHSISMSASACGDVPGSEQFPVPEGRSSRPMLRTTSGGTVDSYSGQAPDCGAECSSFGREITWI